MRLEKGLIKLEAIQRYQISNNSPAEYTQKNSNMSVEEYYNRGKERLNSENYNGAISDFTNVIRITPDFFPAYNIRGISKRRLKDYSGAISDYTIAIEINPNYATAYLQQR